MDYVFRPFEKTYECLELLINRIRPVSGDLELPDDGTDRMNILPLEISR